VRGDAHLSGEGFAVRLCHREVPPEIGQRDLAHLAAQALAAAQPVVEITAIAFIARAFGLTNKGKSNSVWVFFFASARSQAKCTKSARPK